MFDLTKAELSTLRKLSTPIKIQDYLDTLPINFEKKGETHMSPRRVLREKIAHCIEAALLAATALWLRGHEPLILDLKAHPHDDDHVVALYKINGLWGAISKTNHTTVRFRDPIYKTIRELAVSYFHEYFLDKNGLKVLYSYSNPINLKKIGDRWITSEEELWYLDDILNNAPHHEIYPKENKKYIRRADAMERKAGKLREWKK
ncbi:hypothetical protein H0W32_01600 [Patescibacteria group bacterium]|nr:hypothetical protein [Patescibacteria group bacterium]